MRVTAGSAAMYPLRTLANGSRTLYRRRNPALFIFVGTPAAVSAHGD